MSRLPGAHPNSFNIYLLPGLIGLLIIIIIPLLANVYISFTSWRGVGMPRWTGLTNWARILHDQDFWASFGHSLLMILAVTIIPTILGLLTSSLLSDVIQKKFSGRMASLFRGIFYIPQILPIAVATIIMGWIFRPEKGAVNEVLKAIGLGSMQRNWLGSSTWAMPVLMIILIWIQFGYPIVIFMSGLERVDPELYEAASLDGANWWRKFCTITLPEIIPELLVVLLTSTIGALKTFGPVYLLTKGGPGRQTIVPSYYSYTQFFQVQQVGYGATISTALTLVIVVFAIVFSFIQNHVEKNQD
ncbi:sugar ABC transporter permease [Bifidobacterium sp. ESL0775]|uniref:carbohydrate ABC transporter permease n=1 Tax=Bifidobacterium sp. ESL0775 TaxID=2983230 RepID=UPI0023F83F84|nr:sugar ABC transporter permease [Bifidobacterium sp. ESL0775]WEV68550.1 sugar ABC transporter permease [Bifidobacterium sp. ESL0775]